MPRCLISMRMLCIARYWAERAALLYLGKGWLRWEPWKPPPSRLASGAAHGGEWLTGTLNAFVLVPMCGATTKKKITSLVKKAGHGTFAVYPGEDGTRRTLLHPWDLWARPFLSTRVLPAACPPARPPLGAR